MVIVHNKVRFWTGCNDSKDILQECVGLEKFTEVVKREATLRFLKVSLMLHKQRRILGPMCIV